MSKQSIPDLSNRSFNFMCLTELASSTFDVGGLKFAIETSGVDSVNRWLGCSMAEREKMIDIAEKTIGRLMARVRSFTDDVELIEGDDDAAIEHPEIPSRLYSAIGVIMYSLGTELSFSNAFKKAKLNGGDMEGAIERWYEMEKEYRSAVTRRAVENCNWLLVQINTHRELLLKEH